MIESIEFTNFKALRNTVLPLAPFTLLLGPNGSGKSSVLQALRSIATIAPQAVQHTGNLGNQPGLWSSFMSVTTEDRNAAVEIKLRLRFKKQEFLATFRWHSNSGLVSGELSHLDGSPVKSPNRAAPLQWLASMETYALDFAAISQHVAVNSGARLQQNGGGLAAVLDDLRDTNPERWQSLLTEMCEWLPEYDNILFEKLQQGQKGIMMRTKKGGHQIRANDLSQGTMIALALLTLAYLPNPPSLVGLEEIDRGLHPRLLRHLQDALYRLSYPESCGEARAPIQVIATTHSPYLLDLYREHPEEVVLAQKKGLEVKMQRLTDIDHYQEILGEAPLSDVWYSGVLGGVPVKP